MLNTEAGKGGAPPPCDPLGCRATVGAAEGRGLRRNLVPQAPRWRSGGGRRGGDQPSRRVRRPRPCALRRGTGRASRERSPSSAPLRRGAGRAGQCVAGRAGGCRPSIALGSTRRCSEPRSAPRLARGSKGSTASPRRPLPGFEGAESLASPAVIPWVGWLDHLTVVQASRADARETLQRAARDGGHPAVAGKLPGLLVEGLKDDGTESDLGALGGRWRSLQRSPRSPLPPYPSETRDRRSWAILRPVVSPKRTWNAPKRALSPVGPERPHMVAMAAYRSVT